MAKSRWRTCSVQPDTSVSRDALPALGLDSLFICCTTEVVLGRVAGNSMPRGESFRLSPPQTCSLVLLTSNFTGSGSREDVSFQMYLHMSNWILWPWLASLEILTINKPTCIARTQILPKQTHFLEKHGLFSIYSTAYCMDSRQRMEKCTSLSLKSKITSLCSKVFCKVLSAQGEPQWQQHPTNSSLSSMPFASFHSTLLFHCNLDSISTKK